MADNLHDKQRIEQENNALLKQQSAMKSEKMQSESSANRRLDWDTDLIDALAYIVTPIALVVCALLLIISTKSNITSVNCWAPAQFTQEWVQYVNSYCGNIGYLYDSTLKDEAYAKFRKIEQAYLTRRAEFEAKEDEWYQLGDNNTEPKPSFNELKPEFVLPESARFKAKGTDKNNALAMKLLLLATFSLLPIVALRLLGKVDGDSVFSLPSRAATGKYSQHPSISLTIIWFLIVKVLYVVTAVLLFLYTRYALIDHNTNRGLRTFQTITERSEQIGVVPTPLCDFQIRALVNRMQHHTVQCILTKASEDNNVDDNVQGMLYIWTLALMAAVTLNAVASALIYALSHSATFQVYIIKRFVGADGAEVKEFRKRHVSSEDVFVTILAARKGNSGQVSDLWREAWLAYKKATD